MRFSSRLPRNLQPSDFSRLQSDLAASGDLCDLTQSNPTLAGFAIAVVLGLFLAIGRRSRHRWLSWPVTGLIEPPLTESRHGAESLGTAIGGRRGPSVSTITADLADL